MKNKKILDCGVLGGKTGPLKIFMILFCSIFILLLVYVVGALVLMKNNFGVNPDLFFSGCNVIEKNCTDAKCGFYNSCDGAQKQCRVYDCGDAYGIFVQKSDNSMQTKKEKKIDNKAVETRKDNCSGKMQILSQGCMKETFEAKVKIDTKGECNIGSFVLTLQEFGNVTNEFKRADDGTYVITADRCGVATRIVPVTDDGMSLQF